MWYAHTELCLVGTAVRKADDWTGAQTEVFYDSGVNKHTLTCLTAGVEYKVKVIYALTVDDEFWCQVRHCGVHHTAGQHGQRNGQPQGRRHRRQLGAATGATGYNVRHSTDDGAT